MKTDDYGKNTPFHGSYKQKNFSTLAEFLALTPKHEHYCYVCRKSLEENQNLYATSMWGDEYLLS